MLCHMPLPLDFRVAFHAAVCCFFFFFFSFASAPKSCLYELRRLADDAYALMMPLLMPMMPRAIFQRAAFYEVTPRHAATLPRYDEDAASRERSVERAEDAPLRQRIARCYVYYMLSPSSSITPLLSAMPLRHCLFDAADTIATPFHADIVCRHAAYFRFAYVAIFAAAVFR